MMPTRRFTSYAQNLEDVLLWRALRHVDVGFYLDVGAHDPRIDSVSRGFYEIGWRGIHFEPNSEMAASLRRDRPDEEVREIALSDVEGTLRFVVARHSGLSTGSRERTETYRCEGQVARELDVPASTLARACATLSGRDVHWMKIDVEGMEEAVLRGWDPDTLRPWIVVVEATRPNSMEPAHHAWEHLLLDAGYRFAHFDGLNRFYVAGERPELLPAFVAPVNVHDLAGGCELAESSPFVAAAVGRANATIGRMRSSRSWRWTRPLRALHALLRGTSDTDDP